MATYVSVIRLGNVLGSCARRGGSTGSSIVFNYRHKKSITGSPVHISTPGSFTGYRHLFSAAALGVDSYEEKREKVAIEFKNLRDKFQQRMQQVLQSDNQSLIFTEDLKNAIHLAECEDDMSLVIGMAKKFNSQNVGLRFGVYIFGPVVMRMFHYVNHPQYMLQALRSKELEGFFDQIASYQLAMDLLYKGGLYQDAIDVFEELQEKRLNGIKYPKNCLTLAIAACYKINTPESYQKMIEIFEGSQEYGTHLNVRIISFASALALNQGFPHISIEILSRAFNVRRTTIMNLKVLSLVELGRVEDALPILRSVLRADLPDTISRGDSQQIVRNTIERVEQAVKNAGDKELIAEYNNIAKGLEANGHISEKPLDEYICEPVAQLPSKTSKFNDRRDRAMLAASFNRNRGTQWHASRNRSRPGLMDME
ncbi:pentatricopeptide repeat-containing protein 2, mitochondrial-like [Macrobrachium nipponense]|uniref:pentatricopeptide repeat-containing protein 2, mitochondrial-like n=1 Tax=Macrobrachium nipponense TaxID=159736 RepID=UPI0030C80847